MSRIKAVISFIHAWRRPDEIDREVEAELRFHIAMRTRSNIEGGMKPAEAQSAAMKSFGDFDRVKNSCCGIRRTLPLDYAPLRMALHIAVAAVAGFAALWAVNAPHDNFAGVLRQLIPITVLAYLFFTVRRRQSRHRLASEQKSIIAVEQSGASEWCPGNITPHDEEGRTPVERVFKS